MPSTSGTLISSGAAPGASDHATQGYTPVPTRSRALLQRHAKASLNHRAGSRPRLLALARIGRVARDIAARLFAISGADAADHIEFSADYRLVRLKRPDGSAARRSLPWVPKKLFGRNCATAR